MDNLFATPQLFELLRDRNIAATGTTRPGRVDSKQLASLKAKDKSKDVVPWGTVYAESTSQQTSCNSALRIMHLSFY